MPKPKDIPTQAEVSGFVAPSTTAPIGDSGFDVRLDGMPPSVQPDIFKAALGKLDDFIAANIAAASLPATIQSPIHVYHRMPERSDADRRAPRMIVPEEFMAVEPRALERAFFSFFDEDEDDKPYEMHGAVAVVSIDGPLMQRGGWWWDGYESIRSRFEKALVDKAVGAVVLKINSCGGVVSGCFSAARAMRAAKVESKKPVYAFADEAAYSAAYAMASVADEIYLPREGGVGSVGVIGVLEDWTAFNEKMGIRVAVITSGKHKADGHPDVALKADVIARYQNRINMLASSFAELVGEAREMSPEAVLKLEADCFYGDESVKAGLADAVKSFDDVINVAAGEAARRFATTNPRGRAVQVRRYV